MSLVDLCMLAVASGTISVALSNSHLTRSVRLHLVDIPIVGELASCSFCLGFWVSLIFSSIHYGEIAIMQWMTVWGLGSLFSGILLKFYLFREAENEDLRDTIREMSEVIKELTGE